MSTDVQEELTQDELDWLNKPAEQQQIGKFLRKGEYAGKTIKATVLQVRKNKLDKDGKKTDLHILIDGQTEPVIFGCSGQDHNAMLLLFGPNKANWCNKRIKIEFSALKDAVINGGQTKIANSKITAL